MKPKWIIENFTDRPEVRDMIDEVRRQGFEIQVIGPKNGFEYKHINYNNECVVFHGSIQMSDMIKAHLSSCYPVVWLDKERYKCSSYYPHVKHLLFNDLHEFVSVKDLRADPYKFYAKYGKEAMIFIRPDDGDKSFKGTLLDLQDFAKFWDNGIVCNSKEEDLAIVSTPKNIRGEWRFVVDKYQGIIAFSCYRYQGKLTEVPFAPPKAIEKAKEVFACGYHPDSVYCIDICEDDDGNFWLLELNSFSSAGTYACKPELIVKRVSEVAEREWKERHG